MFLSFPWILETSEVTKFHSNSIDCFLQGLIAACGISVLCSLLRVYNFIQTCSDYENGSKQRSSSPGGPVRGNWRATLKFWSLTVLLSLVGSRVSSLIVLEFSLRAVSAWVSAGLDGSGRGLDLLLIQSQCSLGCSLTSTLAFLHQGAPHSCFSLLLAAALSWALASFSHSLQSHVATLYPLHSKERYCGKCITLLTSGHTMLGSLQRAIVLVFALAGVASTTTVYNHFLSQKDALKLWIPLSICYTLLVFNIQEDKHRQSGTQALMHTVVVRLGGLLVLMLTVGYWSDVLHVLITFLGEAVCLMTSQDLLKAVLKEEEETSLSNYEKSSSHKTITRKTSWDDSS
ncbi:transmembrane protein 82-like [Embiotoca jacksoni]|uniref:transmembrane protein 82-like n=1 Tax=Embiotoca jacksoni TaxID=100190 RepID=UPI0037049C87